MGIPMTYADRNRDNLWSIAHDGATNGELARRLGIRLLGKTGAPTPFIGFGNDREVPIRCLARDAELAPRVAFYFVSDHGALEHRRPAGSGR
jgi:hypothetical protein